MSRMRIVIFYLSIFFIVVMIIIGCAEFLSRIFISHSNMDVWTGAAPSEFEHNERLGWLGKKGIYWKDPLSNTETLINSQGYRDDDFQIKLNDARKSQAKKILFIGDSNLFGYRIKKKHRVSEQLAYMFRLHGEKVVSFNFGVPAFGTGQSYLVLEEWFPKINPDFVVYLFHANDISDASFPYDFRYDNVNLRVYKPYFDFDGNLLLNKKVPQRFSLLVRNTFLENFQSRLLVDKLQLITGDITYSLHDISENRNITVNDGVKLTMENLFWSAHYRDLFEKNFIRNYNLIKKMKSMVEKKGSRFIVLAPHIFWTKVKENTKDIVNLFEKGKIEYVQLEKNFDQLLSSCQHTYRDGHPNFIWNYYGALNTFNYLTGKQVPEDFKQSEWYSEIPDSIDFSKNDYYYSLFGNWYDPIEDLGQRHALWISDNASFLLKLTGTGEIFNLVIEGGTLFPVKHLDLLDSNGKLLGRKKVPDLPKFKITFKVKLFEKDRFACLKLAPDQTFYSPVPPERKLSIFIYKIYMEPIKNN